MGTATEEIKVRIAPQQKSAIQQAAELSGQNVSQFIRDAAQARADAVLAEVQFRQVTAMSADEFDLLLEAIDRPGRSNPRVVAAADTLWALDLD